MKLAIALPYYVGQNEPSKPLTNLVAVPDDVDERDEVLTKLFFERVLDCDFDELTVTETPYGYGDITVAYHDDVFLYITFIEKG